MAPATKKQPAKTATKKPVQGATMQIVIKPPTRKASDVAAWRTALQSADMGRIKALFDLYDDLMIDGVLADAVDKRIGAVTNSPITFQDADGQEVQEIVDLIDSPDFEELLTTIMNARFWGRAAGEFSFADGFFNFTPIPFKHIKLENQNILINETDDKGIDYSVDDQILVIGKPRQFGLFLKTAPYAIWKRGGFGDYAQWLELFGMPQRVGKYSSYDPESRRLLEQAMEQAGSAPWIVIPKEADVETTNSASSGSSGSTHNEFRKACNEEMLITILGQTMTTLDGSSKSQSETHKAVEEGKNRADMRYVRRILNWLVVPLLEKRGFPVAGGKFIFPESTEELTVADIVSLSDIMEIPASYLHDKFSIPVPEEGEAIARKAFTSLPADAPSNDPKKTKVTADPAGTKPVKLGDDPIDHGALELRDQNIFWKGLLNFFATATGSVAIKTGARLTPINLIDTGEFNDQEFLKRFYDNRSDFDIDLFNHTASNLIGNFRKGWAKNPIKLADVGFDYGLTNEVAQTMMETNLFHFSAAKTLAECQELNTIFRESTGFDDFLKKAQPKHDIFNKTWAEAEYDTAELTAESSATYHRLKAQTDIFPFWCYTTMADGKVRDSHVPLHGLTLPANDPRWGKIYPPNGWKDRCYVVARTKSEGSAFKLNAEQARADIYLNSGEFKKAAAQGWGVNRAELKQVFTENQMYVKKFPGKASKGISNLTAHDYNLPSINSGTKAASGAVAKYNGEAEAWFNAQEQQLGDLILKDYNKRHLVMSAESFKTHTTGSKASRVPYLDAMKETLQNPAEVWLNGKMLDNVILISYYTDEVLVVVCRIENGTVNKVKTWFPLNMSKGVINKYRSGLLIKKSGQI